MIRIYNGTDADIERQKNCFHDNLDAQQEDSISMFAFCLNCGMLFRGISKVEYDKIIEERRSRGSTRI